MTLYTGSNKLEPATELRPILPNSNRDGFFL